MFREVCHIQQPGGVTVQSLLSRPDVANGFFIKMFTSETSAKKKLREILAQTSCAALHLRIGGRHRHNHSPVQDAVCVLRLKVAKNFQLTGNPEITKTS
jgi:hypothetical protein